MTSKTEIESSMGNEAGGGGKVELGDHELERVSGGKIGSFVQKAVHRASVRVGKIIERAEENCEEGVGPCGG